MDVEHDLGLVLSGGGAKAAAHIGVLKAMEERGISATVVSGTSAGAIVGAMYCSGMNADEMMEVFTGTSIFRPSYYTWKKPGFLDMSPLSKILKKHIPEDNFDALQKKLFVTVTDITEAKQRVFSNGPLIEAVAASSCFPIIFAPYEIGDRLYADGGILNNFPTEPIQQMCKKIIGVNVQHISPIDKSQLKSTFDVGQRIYTISTRFASVAKYQYCDVVIAPHKLNQFNTFSMYKIKNMYDIGYEAACEKFDQSEESFV